MLRQLEMVMLRHLEMVMLRHLEKPIMLVVMTMLAVVAIQSCKSAGLKMQVLSPTLIGKETLQQIPLNGLIQILD